jgi:hypothetical protein
LDDPWSTVPGGNPYPLILGKNMPFVPQGDYLPTNPYLTPTYTQTWNLSIQREVTSGTLFSVAYLGTQVTHLQSASSLNPAIFVPVSAMPITLPSMPGLFVNVTAGAPVRRLPTRRIAASSFENPRSG